MSTEGASKNSSCYKQLSGGGFSVNKANCKKKK